MSMVITPGSGAYQLHDLKPFASPVRASSADVLGVILQALNEMFHAMCLKLLHSAWNNCSRVDKHLLLPFSRFLPSFVPSCLLPPAAPPRQSYIGHLP